MWTLLLLIILVLGYLYYNGYLNKFLTPRIDMNNYKEYFDFIPNTDGLGNDIACNKDVNIVSAMNNCYSDPSCKSVIYSPWNLCRKDQGKSSNPFSGTSSEHGLYIKRV